MGIHTEHRHHLRQLLGLFTQALGSGGTLQPLDEWGNPLPVKDEGVYDVAFPIQGGGTAWGDNRVVC